MDIKGFEGLYKIFPDGRVWGYKMKRFRSLSKSRNGYLCITLNKNAKSYNFLIHRLIAIHYIDNPNNLPIVDHINRIILDNRIENLRWVCPSNNIRNQTTRKDNKLQERNIMYIPAKYMVEFHINKPGEPRKRKTKTFENLKDAIKWRDENNPLP